jgi:cell wall-associated NlpC family hydrolase
MTIHQYVRWGRTGRLWFCGISFCLILIGCATTGGNSIRHEHLRNDLISTAIKMKGRPYRYGGYDPSGFDCSGLVYYSFNQLGLKIPRTSYDQYKASSPVYISRMRPGDLVFFRIDGQFVSHVGIYLGDNRFIHAAGKSKHVRIDDMSTDFWQKRLVGAGSLLN